MAVVGGLIFSQLITLYLTPVVYTYMDALKTRVARLFSGKSKDRHEPLPAVGD